MTCDGLWWLVMTRDDLWWLVVIWWNGLCFQHVSTCFSRLSSRLSDLSRIASPTSVFIGQLDTLNWPYLTDVELMWKQNWVLPRAVWCCDSPQCKPVGFIQVSFSLGSCGHVAAIACASLASYVLYCSLINFKTFMISWLRHEGDVLLEGVCGRLCLEKLFAPVCAVAHGHVQIGARPLRPIQKEHLARRGFSRYLCNYVHIVSIYIYVYWSCHILSSSITSYLPIQHLSGYGSAWEMRTKGTKGHGEFQGSR